LEILMTNMGIMPWFDNGDVAESAVPATPDAFAQKVIYVICNASVTPSVGRQAYERCMRALATGSTARIGFRHPGKADAVDRIWAEREELFRSYRASNDPQAFIATLPWIGPVTRHSLAHLLGLTEVPHDERAVA